MAAVRDTIQTHRLNYQDCKNKTHVTDLDIPLLNFREHDFVTEDRILLP